jgi:photosystem II stability/assembly factor-like uncharacterized protein
LVVAAWIPACGSSADDSPKTDEGTGGEQGTGGSISATGGSNAAGASTKSATGGSTGTGGATSKNGTGGPVGTGGTTQGGAGASSQTGGAGSTGTGASTGSGGSTSLPLPEAGSPDVKVTACPTSATGAWENISPRVSTRLSCGFGIDPQNPSTLYVGTGKAGVYRSSDCGATWAKTNTGTNGDLLDQGEGWDILADWDSLHSVYANSGYGPSGYFKSTDNGTSWTQILPASGAGAAFVYGGFVHHGAMDPTTPGHFILAPHFSCEGGNSAHCMLELSKGGASWAVAQNSPAESEMGGVSMLDATTWFQGDWGGLYRTADQGKTWTQVISSGEVINPALAKAPDGTLYVTGLNCCESGLWASKDRGATWARVPGAPHNLSSVAATPTQLVVQAGLTGFQVASYTNLSSWKPLSASGGPAAGVGWICGLKYDDAHHLLYVLNQAGGLFRFVTQ